MLPHVDPAQIRELKIAVTDGRSFLHVEDCDFGYDVRRFGERSQAYTVTRTAQNPQYGLEETVVCDPDVSASIQRFRFKQTPAGARMYALCTPHMRDSGFGGHGRISRVNALRVLISHKDDRWPALGCDCGFDRASVGFVGASDGLADPRDNFRMDFDFDHADGGNVMLTGELPDGVGEFSVVLAFGESEHAAMTALTQCLSAPFEVKSDKYFRQWDEACRDAPDLAGATNDGGKLLDISRNTLCTHEDREYPGAIIASLAVPWGQVRRPSRPRTGISPGLAS